VLIGYDISSVTVLQVEEKIMISAKFNKGDLLHLRILMHVVS